MWLSQSERGRKIPVSQGFDSAITPYKLFSRLTETESNPEAAEIEVDSCPYGGLLFKPGRIQTIGLPHADLVLCADDVEFTRESYEPLESCS